MTPREVQPDTKCQVTLSEPFAETLTFEGVSVQPAPEAVMVGGPEFRALQTAVNVLLMFG